MEDKQPANFDDPGLKAALQRAYPATPAPAHLRQRVTRALAAEVGSSGASPVAGRIGQSTTYRIAASLIALLGLGVLAYQLYSEYRPAQPPLTYSAPAAFIDEMIARHDASLTDATLLSSHPGLDYAALSKNLSSKLGKPAAAVPLGDGWKLQGAGICKVGDTTSAELLFQRGGTSVSLFSVPTRADYAPGDGTRYNEQKSDYLVAGIVHDRVIYCLVGRSIDHTLSMQVIQALRDELAVKLGVSRSCDTPQDQTAFAGQSI
jgi:hypothetical protein